MTQEPARDSLMTPPLTFAATEIARRSAELESLVRDEIPLAAQMEVTVEKLSPEGLWLSMPLAPNRNPHQTAFAGSLNALCTLAGWAATHLLLEQLGRTGSTVLRRSSIKYHTPVESARVTAHCLPPREADWEYFQEMLEAKGRAKLDHVVEVGGGGQERPAVLFGGSYVVLAAE